MAAQPRIHPGDLEAGSSAAPLVSRAAVNSEKGDRPLPSPHHAVPLPHAKPTKPKKKSHCCRCLCWTICLLILFVVLLAASAGVLYLVFQPKAPNYTVDRLRVTAFNTTPDGAAAFAVAAAFNVAVTATNPNKNIGIFYEERNHLSILYQGTSLCEGSFPAFYQGHRNTTVLTVAMAGNATVGVAEITSLMAQQQAGGVPLVFRGSVPVRIKFGALKLWKVRFIVTCDLVVNALTVGDSLRIQSSRCGFKFRM
ncbi:NDR1/HIN1-like protein 6 [Wolffia australiana]